MQQDIFDIMYEKYIIKKPIRLIELFAGYGSQHFSLKYLGANVESWRIVEWAVPSIQAYKDAHFPTNNFDYSNVKSFEVIVDILFDKGISVDYNQPMTKEQIQRKGEKWCRQVFNNICVTNNLVNIQNVKGEYLGIEDTDKYDYIMTYSFPCQDLSLAGKRAGMSDTSTRSGMLWEVERILDEIKNDNLELPQILLMENVPQVIGKDNVEHFNKWCLKLEELGYKNYHQNLIATDYGIPQTRNRTFMISILGDYSYTFPQPIPLKLKLKDMLEDEVDEKYYLSDKQLNDISNWNAYEKPLEHIDDEEIGTLTTRSGAYCSSMKLVGTYQYAKSDNFMQGKDRLKLGKEVSDTIQTTPKEGVVLKTKLCNELIEKGLVKENDVIKHSYTEQISSGNKKCIEMNNIMPTMTTRPDCLGVATKQDNNLRIRKLTPKECFRLMGVKDEDYERIAVNQSNSSLYHLAGDSIVINVLMAIFKELLNDCNKS